MAEVLEFTNKFNSIWSNHVSFHVFYIPRVYQ